MAGRRHPPWLRLVVDDADLSAWLGKALRGDVLQYHRGILTLDVDPHTGRMSESDRAKLRLVANHARWAFEQGLTHLVQRRLGADDYCYLMVMRMRPTDNCAGGSAPHPDR